MTCSEWKFQSTVKQSNQVKFTYKSQTLAAHYTVGINATLRSEVNTVEVVHSFVSCMLLPESLSKCR